MKTGINNPARGRGPFSQDYRSSLYLQGLIDPPPDAEPAEPRPDRVTSALWYLGKVERNMNIVCRVRQDWPYRDVKVAAEYMRAAMMLLRGEAEEGNEKPAL